MAFRPRADDDDRPTLPEVAAATDSRIGRWRRVVSGRLRLNQGNPVQNSRKPHKSSLLIHNNYTIPLLYRIPDKSSGFPKRDVSLPVIISGRFFFVLWDESDPVWISVNDRLYS